MFGCGEVDSPPPHLDPKRVGCVSLEEARDRDHVGANSIGRYGNDATIYVVTVYDKAGGILFAEAKTRLFEAKDLCHEIQYKIERARQALLF